jgi:hypothetical protein
MIVVSDRDAVVVPQRALVACCEAMDEVPNIVVHESSVVTDCTFCGRGSLTVSWPNTSEKRKTYCKALYMMRNERNTRSNVREYLVCLDSVNTELEYITD